MIDLRMRQVCFSYFNGLVLDSIDLAIAAGQMVAILGPNGSGKTTLIKLACGILRPKPGEIRLDGTDLARLGRKCIARSVAVVPQQFHIPFAFTVAEVVMLGRAPFIKAFTEEREDDRQAVANALQLVGITRLQDRRFDELSGGERQKVIVAMALAQQPKLLLLDEPTVHLDITCQVEILELVRKLNTETGLTVIAAIHDLNLAALYFDRLVLLRGGKLLADGTPFQVLTETNINEAFAASVKVATHPVVDVPHVVITPREKQP
ncbi:MAG: ABC transporter ATP-binding protein [Chloroflexi bacterium]|nr:ABC transporter ATP-binding protein [Chloroflexota bacterium]